MTTQHTLRNMGLATKILKIGPEELKIEHYLGHHRAFSTSYLNDVYTFSPTYAKKQKKWQFEFYPMQRLDMKLHLSGSCILDYCLPPCAGSAIFCSESLIFFVKIESIFLMAAKHSICMENEGIKG